MISAIDKLIHTILQEQVVDEATSIPKRINGAIQQATKKWDLEKLAQSINFLKSTDLTEPTEDQLELIKKFIPNPKLFLEVPAEVRKDWVDKQLERFGSYHSLQTNLAKADKPEEKAELVRQAAKQQIITQDEAESALTTLNQATSPPVEDTNDIESIIKNPQFAKLFAFAKGDSPLVITMAHFLFTLVNANVLSEDYITDLQGGKVTKKLVVKALVAAQKAQKEEYGSRPYDDFRSLLGDQDFIKEYKLIFDPSYTPESPESPESPAPPLDAPPTATDTDTEEPEVPEEIPEEEVEEVEAEAGSDFEDKSPVEQREIDEAIIQQMDVFFGQTDEPSFLGRLFLIQQATMFWGLIGDLNKLLNQGEGSETAALSESLLREVEGTDEVPWSKKHKVSLKRELAAFSDLLKKSKKIADAYEKHASQSSVDPRYDGSRLKAALTGDRKPGNYGILGKVQIHAGLLIQLLAKIVEGYRTTSSSRLDEAMSEEELEEARKKVRAAFAEMGQIYTRSLRPSLSGELTEADADADDDEPAPRKLSSDDDMKVQQAANNILEIAKTIASYFPRGLVHSRTGKVVTLDNAIKAFAGDIKGFARVLRDLYATTKDDAIATSDISRAYVTLQSLTQTIDDVFDIPAAIPKKAKKVLDKIVPDGDKSFSTDEPEDTDETDPAEPDPSDEDFVDTAVEKEDFPSDETKDVVAPLLKRKAEEENYDESEVLALVDLTRKMLPVTSGPVPREIASKVINAIDIDDIEFHQAAIDGKLRYQKQPIYRKLNQMQRAAIDNFLRILFKNLKIDLYEAPVIQGGVADIARIFGIDKKLVITAVKALTASQRQTLKDVVRQEPEIRNVLKMAYKDQVRRKESGRGLGPVLQEIEEIEQQLLAFADTVGNKNWSRFIRKEIPYLRKNHPHDQQEQLRQLKRLLAQFQKSDDKDEQRPTVALEQLVNKLIPIVERILQEP